MIRRALAGLTILLAVLVACAPAQAIAPADRGAAFDRIEKKTMCVQCNVPLNIAVAPEADAERVQIRRLLSQGLSERQVLDSLAADYGPNILATPPAKGFNLLVFVVPVAVLLALLALGAVLLPRWKRNRQESVPDDPRDDDGPSRAENERLDAELARYGA